MTKSGEGALVTLTKPIKAHGDEVGELRLREPTAGDIQACGYPLVIGHDESVSFDGSAMVKLIGRLAEIPPSSAQQLSFRDFQACATLIASFFGDAQAA